MIKKLLVIISLVINFIGIIFVQTSFCFEQLQQVPALIHISSTFSDGRYKPEQIIDIAEKAGFKIIVFNEREVMRWEYGIWPLRKILKKVIKNSSLATYGIKNYLKKIEDIQIKNPGLLLIPGIESTPFYYWSGSIFKKNFTLHNAHKHLLIFGLGDVKDIKNLPVVANYFTLAKPYKLSSLKSLWPILSILLGVILFVSNRQTVFRNSLEKQEIKNKKNLGIIIVIISGLFLINNFPFREYLFDQYHGDQGILPYQNMIDYVNEKHGLVFWAHPEAENISQTKYVQILTKEHTKDFYETKNYTGFSVFYEGYDRIGRPTQLWDKVLLEYLQGVRRKPAWAIGGLAFDYSGDLKQAVKDLRNIVLLDKLNRESFLDALRKGKVYVIRGRRSKDFVLDDFSIEDQFSGENRIIGQSLQTNSPQITVNIKGDFKADITDNMLSIHLIKNGNILKTFKNKGSFDIHYTDNINTSQVKVFYRLEIRSHGLHVITNPIFVQ